MSVSMDTVLPPGPGECDLSAMRADPLGFLSSVTRTYGDVVSYTTGGQRIYLINRPELARHVLKDNAANYTKDGTPGPRHAAAAARERAADQRGR